MPSPNYFAVPQRLFRRATGRIRAATRVEWFVLLFAILLLAFFVALLLAPTAGRGGR